MVKRMSDLIERQAAIDATWEEPTYTDPMNVLTEVRDRINNLPSAQPEQKWIPCSERLPEENMWTICQNNAGAMMIGKYDIAFGWMFPTYFDGIVAWMTLPEPYESYKEES